jgi:K+-sensing histidine kinase KdpD
MTTIYRNYEVSKLNDTFVGQSEDDESLLISRSYSRLTTGIDQMWDCLDRGGSPAWFSGSSAIDLDEVSLDASGGPEAVASETDPPANEWKIPYWLFGCAALGISAPIAFAMDFLRVDARIDVIMTLGVCAVALAFGRNYALIAAGIATIITNFFAVEPLFHFSWPTISELWNGVIDFGVAVIIPQLVKEEVRFRRWLE